MFLFLNFSILLTAQSDEFIDVINEVDFSLNDSELARYNSFKGNPMYENVYPAEIKSVSDFQQTGFLTFNLPNQTSSLTAKAVSVEAYSDNDYTWYGQLVGEQEGTVLLVAKDNRLDGRISVDDEVFLIQSLSDSKTVLIDVDESKFTAEECANNGSGGGDIQNETSVDIRDHCEDLPIRVLFLYTTAASNICIPNSTANLIIAQLNQITNNSDISLQHDLRFTKAGVAPITSFNETANIATDVNTLNLPTTMPAYIEANNLRDLFEADIVVVFTDGNYGTFLSGPILGATQAGVAAPGVVLGGPNLPFAIVELDAATSFYTAVHEIGHLLGGRHQQCSLWSNGGCSNQTGDFHGSGWGEKSGKLFSKWKNYNTVMHQHRSGNTRLPNFSNPNVYHNGSYPTGATGIRNNARVFSVNGCTVAQYRDFIPPFSASINGITWADNSGPYTFTAEVENGISPYLYQWSYSTTGFNFILNSSQTGPQLTMLMPPGDYTTLYLRLDVADATGTIVTAFHQVHLPNDCEMCFQSIPSNDLEVGKESTTIIYPNPASDIVQVIFEVKKEEEGEVNLVLADMSGNIIQQIPQGYLKEGNYFINMPLHNTASGVHIVRIQKGNKIETQKLFITH